MLPERQAIPGSHQPNCLNIALARRFNFAVASERRSNASFLSLRLMAVAQATSSMWTTRRMATAVCSLLNMSPGPVRISKSKRPSVTKL